MNWLAQLFGGSPQNAMVTAKQRPLSWTTEEELLNARKYDLAYGDPSAGFFQEGARVRQPDGWKEMQTAFNSNRMDKVGLKTIDDATAKALQAAWLVARSSPLAALGFDPRSMVVGDPTAGKQLDTTVNGAYWPKSDTAFTTGKNDSTLVHESIHRGLEMLRKAGLLPDEAKAYQEEYLTRAFMQKYYGDVEKGRGETGDAQILLGASILNSSKGAAALAAAERAAAQYIAQRTPRGPR